MSFIKRDVKDRVVQYPRRYRLVEVQPSIFDLIPEPGTVTEEGTAINKAYLQPLEDGLENALEKTGDGKDVTVTFTEAATEAHIASGEKLSVMFGKILKMFKGKAPNSHASSGTTYGVGTTANYGHCKTINNLTQASHVNGNALSAYQGKVLKDLVDIADNPNPLIYEGTIPTTPSGTIIELFTFDITKYRQIFAQSYTTGIYSIIKEDQLIGVLSNTSEGNIDLVVRRTLSSTPVTIASRGSSSGQTRVVIQLKVVGNLATVEARMDGGSTGGDYVVIIK